MTTRVKWTIVGVPVLVVALVAGALAIGAAASQPSSSGDPSEASEETAPTDHPVQYSVKFVCGWLPPVPPDLDQLLKPGDYATSINIANPTNTNPVLGSKRVLLSSRMGAQVPPLVPPFIVRVFRLRVLTVDCVDLWAMASLPPGSFFEGALHIGLDQQLPVTAVYTSQTHDDPNAGPGAAAGHSIDVEQVDPFLVVPG